MIVNTDIDIDVADRRSLLKLIKNVPALIERDGKKVKHNTGVYFHDIPSDPFSGLSTIDYQKAEERRLVEKILVRFTRQGALLL